ncbi:mediator of RNA polymerase II transcription subunit 15a-like [Dorcoceras hygrometricum]|uniref:Mediator of RNA polymerase II transcription subunit 15a-like n=1 Tax=Dorcoceras hygrometricum TaxID=472368 RepID=A0A2Z7D2N4_9LAMI|nr:mediator of RNA polymerase II transcription subunit 15a-like [Dorcoceras hygrometricum]
MAYLKSGFDGAVAQFRAHGYPEEEHPAPFLDMKKALREMPDEEEKAEEVATRGSSSAELGLVAERVGLVSVCVEELREWPVRNWALALRWGCHPRRCHCGTGLKCRAGRAYVFT